MDKNKISIDDLLTRRMSGAEEDERPGAWLRMRDLLDEKLPVTGTAIGVNWHRIMMYVSSAAVVATLGLCTYEIANALKGDNNSSRIVANTYSNTEKTITTANDLIKEQNAAAYIISTVLSNNASFKNTTNTTSPNGQDNDPISRDGINTASYATTHHIAAGTQESTYTSNDGSRSKHINNSPIAENNASAGLINKKHRSGITAHTNTTTAQRVSNAQKNTKNKQAQTSDADNTNTLVATNKTGATSNSKSVKNYSTANNTSGRASTNNDWAFNEKTQQLSDNRTSSNEANTQTTSQPDDLSTASDKNIFAASADNSKNSNVAATGSLAHTQLYALEKDTINKIEVIVRYVPNPHGGPGQYIMDTVDKSKFTTDKVLPYLNDQARVDEQQTAQSTAHHTTKMAKGRTAVNNNEPIFFAANSAHVASDLNLKKDKDQLASLTQFHSAANKNKGWDFEQFNDIVRDTKYNLKQVKFAPGIIAGINATFFAPNNMTGFHLGITGMFQLNEHWGIMAELKYIQRINNGRIFSDNYQQYNLQDSAYSAGNKKTYTWQKDSVEHYFNYATIHSLELPLTVRYSAGRFNFFLGGTLVYHFGINADEISHVDENGSELTSTTATPPIPSDNPNGPQVALSDFKARFAMGYLLGLSYQFSPNIQLDARMVQPVWDNASTGGAKLISDDLYKRASLELSVACRLNK